MRNKGSQQLPLIFDIETPAVEHSDGLGSVTWSHSRRSSLERCARRYYDDYYGANARTAKDEPAKGELRRLKSIETRHERAGKLMHLAIRTYFKQALRGELREADRLANWVREIFRADRDYSRGYHEGMSRSTAQAYPPVLLLEYYYGYRNADELCEETEERLYDAVLAFTTKDAFAEFRFYGASHEALVEHHFRLGALPCPAEGVVDLAYQLDGLVTIVDWKMGEYDGRGDDSLQLATYALWATEHFGCAPEAIRVCEVHPVEGVVVDFDTAADVLAAARARIVQDAQRMELLHPYGQGAVAEAFTKRLHPSVCRPCRYGELCLQDEELVL